MQAFFPFQVVDRIILRDEGVAFGAPLRIIRSVQDSDQVIRPLADYTFEAGAKFRSLNFLRVAAAHGGQIVRIDQASLEEVDLSVEFEGIHGEEIVGKADGPHRGLRKDALIGEIVNRQDDWKRADNRILGVLGAENHGHKRRLPIVAVNHVREPHALDAFNGDARKFREALVVIRIVAVFISVELGTIEESGSSTKR